ncbi:hypothetical protein BH10PSE5_BH10PSE5_01410 [soil metagenome]
MPRLSTVLFLIAAACGLTACGTTGLAERAAALSSVIEARSLGCTKTLDVLIQATGILPPAGTIHLTKICGGPQPVAVP